MALPGVVRRALSTAGGPVRRRLLQGATPIRAYHGSPAYFDQFDPRFIGTGEGAQTYGQGMYLTSEPNIAEWYRRTLENRPRDLSASVYDEQVQEAERETIAVLKKLIEDTPPMRDFFGGDYHSPFISDFKWSLRPPPRGGPETRSWGKGDYYQSRLDAWGAPPLGEFDDEQVAEGALTGFSGDERIRPANFGIGTNEAAHRASSRIKNFVTRRHPYFTLDKLQEFLGDKDPANIRMAEGDYNVGEPEMDRLMAAALPAWKKAIPAQSSRLYEVDIHAALEELLDLNKPLEAQSLQVQQPLRELFHRPPRRLLPPTFFATMWPTLDEMPGFEGSRWGHFGERHLFNNPAVSLSPNVTRHLGAQGVPGAHYKGRSSGKQDFVVWDTDRLKIRNIMRALEDLRGP
jgi:hypothetical protein